MAEKTFTYADRVEVWDGNNLISITPIERPDEPDEPSAYTSDNPNYVGGSFYSPVFYPTPEARKIDQAGTGDMARGIIKTIPDIGVAIPELLATIGDAAAGTQMAPTIRREYEEVLSKVGLLPETEYGEVANLVGVFGTGLIGGIRYANAATRAAQNQKLLNLSLIHI